MFIGEYNHNIDDKNRLAIPVKFRMGLAEGAVITRGLDGCLFLYPKNEWQIILDRLSALPFTDANARALNRFMLAGAVEVALDKQGRIVLPAYLKKFALLQKEVVFTGLANRIELWDQKTWQEYEAANEERSSEVAANLIERGI